MPNNGRRWDDTLPPELDPLSNSEWDKLSEPQRMEWVRLHSVAVLERHVELRDLVAEVKKNVEMQAETLTVATAATVRIEASLLANTGATQDSSNKLDKLLERSEPALQFADDVRTLGRVGAGIGDFARKIAWVVIPGGAAVWAANAAVDALKTWKLWPW